MQKGVAKLRRLGAAARAETLERWLIDLLVQFDQRVLAVTASVARRAGNLEDAAIATGRSPGFANILIAATAQEHDLTVLTSNPRHFAMLGVPHFDPFAAAND
jgi:predicted nucleic acid-binding protein